MVVVEDLISTGGSSADNSSCRSVKGLMLSVLWLSSLTIAKAESFADDCEVIALSSYTELIQSRWIQGYITTDGLQLEEIQEMRRLGRRPNYQDLRSGTFLGVSQFNLRKDKQESIR